MNITPVTFSMNRVNTLNSTKKQTAQNQNNQVNFEANGKARRRIAGTAAALALLTAATPTAKAYNETQTPTYPPSCSYSIEDIEPEYPNPEPSILAEPGPQPLHVCTFEDILGIFYPLALDEEGKASDDQIQDLRRYIINSFLPSSNRVEADDDLMVAQAKDRKNLNLLLEKSSSIDKQAADCDKQIEEADDTEDIERLENDKAVLNIISDEFIDIAYGTSLRIADRSRDIAISKEYPSDRPVPNPIAFPIIDTFEDIYGYDRYMTKYVNDLIPDYDSTPEAERNTILITEADKLQKEAERLDERYNKLRAVAQQMWNDYYSDSTGDKKQIDSLIMQVSSTKSKAERAHTVATRLYQLVSGEYKLRPDYPPMP